MQVLGTPRAAPYDDQNCSTSRGSPPPEASRQRDATLSHADTELGSAVTCVTEVAGPDVTPSRAEASESATLAHTPVSTGLQSGSSPAPEVLDNNNALSEPRASALTATRTRANWRGEGRWIMAGRMYLARRGSPSRSQRRRQIVISATRTGHRAPAMAVPGTTASTVRGRQSWPCQPTSGRFEPAHVAGGLVGVGRATVPLNPSPRPARTSGGDGGQAQGTTPGYVDRAVELAARVIPPPTSTPELP